MVALLFVPTESERHRLEHHLRGRAEVRLCGRPVELVRLAERAERAIVICELEQKVIEDLEATLQSFRRRFPNIPILSIFSGHGPHSQRLLQVAAQIRAECVLEIGSEYAAVIERLLDLSVKQSAAGRIMATITGVRPDLDPYVHAFFHLLAHSSRQGQTVASLASEIGVSLRTLQKHLHEEKLPRAHVLAWTVLTLRAAYLLQDAQSTRNRAVAILPFPDAAALSARCRRYLGMAPSAMRRAGKFEALLKEFEETIRA